MAANFQFKKRQPIFNFQLSIFNLIDGANIQKNNKLKVKMQKISFSPTQ